MNQRIEALNQVAGKIEQHVDSAIDRWNDLTEQILTFRSAANAWSIKEVIGHLIDSASNNHQRFVRLQLTKQLAFPDYSQDNTRWVRIQNYQDRNWEDLLALWRHFNIQLAHIVRSVDASCLNHTWSFDAQTRVTLFDLMTDYLRHLKVHLDQIRDNLESFETTSKQCD